MTNNSVYLEESEVIRLILQFLNSRKLNKSMRNLERESGITNCSFTEDVVFLRQLILDGEWDAILTFAKPLEKLEDFDMKKFRYLVLKEKFMEVLYFKSGDEGVSSTYSIEDLVKCLNQLEQDCPFKSDYTKLCWLLTVPDLQETEEYKDWNPETARIKCFREILELFKNVMPVEKKTGNNKISRKPSKDRLVNLIIKGLCFESCVDYCHQRAINGQTDDDALSITKDVLGGSLHESTGNFISWLRSLPQESFLAPFEPMSLNIEFKKAEHSRKFHLSNKRLKYEAENLSKSLSLSKRPSTADNAQPTSTTREIKGTLITEELNERSQSALATSVNKVSNSYGDFHYKGEIGNHNSQLIKTESGSDGSPKVDGRDFKNGTGSENTANKINGQYTGSKNGSTKKNYCENPPSLPLIINDDQNAGTSTQDISSEKPNIAEYDKDICKSQDSIDRVKNIPESSVLKRLEEHEQRRMELQQELMNGTVPNRVENQRNGQLSCQGQARDLSELPDNLEAQKEKKTMQSLTKTKSSDTPDKNVSHSDEKIYREAPVGKEVSPNFNEYVIEAPLHYAVTSTPLTKKKLKPEPLTFDMINNEAPTGSYLEEKDKGLHDPHQKFYIEDQKENEIQPNNNRQSINQFVKTPKANVLQPGHWVALKDGSGVMNISTPKSCREKMSNTPGPPASPVFDHSNQEPAVNSRLHPVTDVKQDVGYRLAGDYEERDLQYEENIAADVDENPPARRGPKINGVRRSLVSTGPPMSRNKSSVTPPEESREAKTPRQERPTSKNLNKDLKGKTNGMSSPRDQKQVPARKSSKEETGNGKKRNSGITFVVDKDAPSGTANLTYRKPTSQLPVSSISEPKSTETTRLLERQKQHLMSTSESIRFSNVASLEDVQAVRAVAFHPSGDLFGIGSNSKTLRVCSASGLSTYKKMESGSDLIAPQPTILFKRNRHHKGSIYCIAWNNSGDLIATGSNDKSIKVLHFDAENCTQIGPEMEMNIHSGTVRDLAFASRSGGSNVLVSGGAGSGNILISDSSTGNTVGQLRGHSSHIMSVFAAKDDIIASGSNDNTVRLWDLRSQRCIDVIATGDSCVASVCVSPNCSLLSSGHEDGGCMIYDITAGRTLQFFKPHTQDCRSVRFSPSGHHLLTGSYDTSIIFLDMQNNLDCNIPPYSVVAQHKDKVIQCRWHPYLMAFVTSSADKTAVLWTLDC